MDWSGPTPFRGLSTAPRNDVQFKLVVMKTGIEHHFLSPINQKITEVNQRMKSNFYTKIPEYAKNFKKEYLFIIGIKLKIKRLRILI